VREHPPDRREVALLVQHARVRNNHFTEMCCGTEAGSYLRLIVSLSIRLKDLLGPVTRVKKKTGSHG